MIDATVGLELDALWNCSIDSVVYKNLVSKMKKIKKMMESHVSVPLNWVGENEYHNYCKTSDSTQLSNYN